VLVEHANVILAQLERAGSDLARTRSEITGTLSVSSFPSATATILTPAVRLLAGRHPEVTLRIDELEPDESLDRLVSSRLDLALVYESEFVPTIDRARFVCGLLLVDPLEVALAKARARLPSPRRLLRAEPVPRRVADRARADQPLRAPARGRTRTSSRGRRVAGSADPSPEALYWIGVAEFRVARDKAALVRPGVTSVDSSPRAAGPTARIASSRCSECPYGPSGPDEPSSRFPDEPLDGCSAQQDAMRYRATLSQGDETLEIGFPRVCVALRGVPRHEGQHQHALVVEAA
jgi:DNA-binding transcriptional LysR family regulator